MPDLFAIIQFGNETWIDPDHPREIKIALPPLGSQTYVEVWRSQQLMKQDQQKQLHYYCSDDFIFASLLIDESAFGDLSAATNHGYQLIHDLLVREQFPNLIRMWNYFPGINLENGRLERYRAFCIGRHQALDNWHYPEAQLPAASAIGTQSGGLLIYFVATRNRGMQIENPRQVSAFNYPEIYGPKTPSFSRAIYQQWQDQKQLYISGTASITGHQSQHTGNTEAQIYESLKNIHALLKETQQQHPFPKTDISSLNYIRAYLRNPEEIKIAEAQLKSTLGDQVTLQIVQGEICRQELNIELDGMVSSI